ncbi:MAG: hypothetical protein LRZ85_09310 [Alphaproteobacteria bacterium]|nr:hypothetical protein [Alphaproteobacteria bacterium]
MESKKAKVIKANYELQQRVGTGTLDEEKVAECEKIIQENNIDFAPMATDFLNKLAQAIQFAKSPDVDLVQAKQKMTQPVMELKANAAIFKYDLIGTLANVMLSFLEAVKTIDKTVIDIVEAHHKTLSIIVLKKMSGDGGEAGKLFEQELKEACKRYFTKASA